MEGTKDLGLYRIERLKDSEVMLAIEYEAESLGDPDPNWDGEEKRSRQDIALEKIIMCNLALWLAKPSPLGFDFYIHINHIDTSPLLRDAASTTVLRSNISDTENALEKEDFEKAKELYSKIKDIPRNSALWISMISLFQALTSQYGNIRFMLLWIALESLFGINSELRFRVSQRIAFFLSDNKDEALQLFNEAKVSYDMRSCIVHGSKYKNKKDCEEIGCNTEKFIRNSLIKILDNDNFIRSFNDNTERNKYLDELVFKG